MEIEIYKENSSKAGGETEYLKIESYNLIVEPKNLLFFKDGNLTLEDNSEVPMYEIRKIQFIASCKTKFKEEILVAFYLGEYSGLFGYVISDLPIGYYTPQGYLIDYNSYLEICDLTGETKMSLIEYYQSAKEGHYDPNSIVKYKDKYLNSDEHRNIR